MAFMVPQRDQQYEDGMDIIALPEVVQKHICTFLDLSGLMNLRLSCKTLKKVVELPTVLELMPVKIRCSKQLQRVVESHVQYNFFILSFMSLEDQSHFYRFINRFGHCIRKLIVTTSTSKGSKKILTLLKNCNQLQELELSDLDFNGFTTSENQDLCDQVIQNLKKIRKLIIHSIHAYQLSATNARIQIDTFFKILSKCRNLEKFKIPEFVGYSLTTAAPNQNEIGDERRMEDVNSEDEEDWEPINVPPAPQCSGMDGDGDVLIRSVLKYIASRPRDASSPRLKTIDVTAIPNFKWDTFHEFAATCYNRNIRLDDMNSSQFFKLKNEMSTMLGHYHDIFFSAKVYPPHEGFPLSKMRNLRKITVYIGFEKDGYFEDVNIDLPNLENLELKFVCSASQRHDRILTQKLLDTPRPKVKQLTLEWIQQPCETIYVMKIAKNFRNLTELNLKEWNGSDDNFIELWMNLNLLENVTLRYCKNITNRAFVGDYDLSNNDNICLRPFNRLTRLHRLVIEDLTGSVTEIALLDSFRWMKLRYLKFFSSKIDMFSVDVYRSMVNSPFGKYIEYFSAPQPMSNRRHDANAVLRGFKNLKKRFGDLS